MKGLRSKSRQTDEATMKHEYREGPKAAENFKKLATAVLQKTKVAAAPKKQPKAKPAGKKRG